MHELSVDELYDLTASSSSETARRLTDLFGPPAPRQIYFSDGRPTGIADSKHLHIAANGVAMRSKNEVIIGGASSAVSPLACGTTSSH